MLHPYINIKKRLYISVKSFNMYLYFKSLPQGNRCYYYILYNSNNVIPLLLRVQLV